jgi:hypothetical protein
VGFFPGFSAWKAPTAFNNQPPRALNALTLVYQYSWSQGLGGSLCEIIFIHYFRFGMTFQRKDRSGLVGSLSPTVSLTIFSAVRQVRRRFVSR